MNRALKSKPTQTAFPSKWRYQQRQFIFREFPPFCFSHFSLISSLSHYSSVGSVSITTPDLSFSFCFLQYALAFFSFSSLLMEGQGPGVDGRRGRSIHSGSRLFSFIRFSCSFLSGGNLIRRAITFGGHLSPWHLWKVLLENKSYCQIDRDRKWGENEIASRIHRRKEWMTWGKGRKKGCDVCLPTVSSFCCSTGCSVPCTFVESVCCTGSFCLFMEGQSNIDLWARVHHLFYQCRLPGASRRHMKPHARLP